MEPSRGTQTIAHYSKESNPGRVPRLAQRMAGRTCAMRCLLTGPKTCVERLAIGGEKSRCCSTSQSKVVAGFLHFAWKGSNNGAGTFQPTHNFTCLESAACHGALKHSLFRGRGNCRKGGLVTAACCSVSWTVPAFSETSTQCLNCAVGHGAMKQSLFQSRAKGMEGDPPNAARRFDVRKAIGQCIGPNSSPEPCRETDDVNSMHVHAQT